MVRALFILIAAALLFSCGKQETSTAIHTRAFENIDFGISKTEFENIKLGSYELSDIKFEASAYFDENEQLHTVILQSQESDPDLLGILYYTFQNKYGDGKRISKSGDNGDLFIWQWIDGNKETRIGTKGDFITCWISDRKMIFEKSLNSSKTSENDKEKL